MEIIAKETKGTSYNTYKYSFDSIGLPSIVYDDDSAKIMKWQDFAETVKHIKSVDLKPLADVIAEEEPLIIPYPTSKGGAPETKLEDRGIGVIQDYMVESEKRMVAELVKKSCWVRIAIC